MSVISRMTSLSKTMKISNLKSVLRAQRNISGSRMRKNQSKVEEQRGLTVQRPSEWEKKLLVGAKMYKSIESVPKTVSTTQIVRAKEWWRVRASLTMLIGAASICFAMVLLGKYNQRAIRLDRIAELDHQNTKK